MPAAANAGPVIVGCDGTGHDADAIALAGWLAEAWERPLLAVHVRPRLRRRPGADLAADEAAVQSDAGHLVADLGPELPEGAAACVVAASSPAHGLHDAAVAEDAAAVVVGSTHHGHVGRVLIGAVGERLLSGSPCAVAVAPHGFAAVHPPMRTVGVAFDDSAEARGAAALAGRLAERMGARVELIAVADPLESGWPGLSARIDPAQTELDVAGHLEAALGAARAALPGAVGGRQTVLHGLAEEQLEAASERVDVLVTGSRGYGPLGFVFWASIAKRLMHTAGCPVVVLPRGAGAPGQAAAQIAGNA
jgi:nucleotide-binding universal stress UspA family protein